jgi:phosphate-selective porin OprO/OprP
MSQEEHTMPIRSVRSYPLVLGIALVGAVTFAPPAVRAADDAPAAQPATPPADLDSRVKELEETVRQLREQLQQLQQAPRPTVDPAQIQKAVDDRLKQQKPVASAQSGFTLQSADGDFTLRVGGLLQASSRWFPANGGDTGANSFYLRRARPILEGTVYKNIGFRLMPDFGLGATVIQDGYLDLKYWPQAQLRLGKFKEPISIERLQSAADVQFVERSIANLLAPNRDVGAQLSGDLSQGTVGYQFGVFNGVNDGGSSDGDNDDGKDIAARLFLQPFKNKTGSAAQGLGFGVAGSLGRQKDPLSTVQYRTSGRSTFFKYDAAAVGNGERRRIVPQLNYYVGPFGLMGEYIDSKQAVRKGTTRADLSNTGWFLQASYLLTGEKAGYRSPTPAKPFDPSKHQWGAWELAARYAKVNVDNDAFRLGLADPAASASDARAFTLGINWYLNKALKAQFNWERTDFNRRIKFGTDQRDHENVLLTQFQLAF